MSNSPSVARRSVVAASIGNAMEWYDFSVYAFFASYIAHNFFRDDDPTLALISAFVVFGAGFVARPLGAVIVGVYGDRAGRKAALMLSIGAMAAGTFIIAVTPPLAFIGIGAPILLLIGRLFQGFSTGGEIGGAAAFMIEHAPADRRGMYASWLQASMGVSNLIAAVVGLAITTFFSEPVIQEWAWRVPFFIGLLIVPIGLYIRSRLPETEDFQRHRTEERARTAGGPDDKPAGRGPLLRLVAEHPRELLVGFLLSILWTVCVYAFVIYMPTYYKSIGLGFTAQDSFLASLAGNIVLIAGCVYFGRLADRVGAKPIVVWSSAVMLVLPPLLLMWLHAAPSVPVLLVVHAILCLNVSAFTGIAPSTLPRIFPVAVRATGLAISYNVAAVFFAGFTPALMTWATAKVTAYAPALWVAVGAVACLAATPALFRQIARQEAAEHAGTEQAGTEHAGGGPGQVRVTA